MSSDILYLINYRNEEMVGDTLKLMELAEKVSFRGGGTRRKRRESLISPEVNFISKEELLENRKELREQTVSFWGNRRDGRFLTISELVEEVKEYNDGKPESEQIKSKPSYQKHYKNIEGAHSNPDKYYGAEWEEIGEWKGFSKVLGFGFLTLKELVEEVKEYNDGKPESEQITHGPSYREHRDKIEGAHSNPNIYYGTEWEEIGKWKGFSKALGSCENLFTN